MRFFLESFQNVTASERNRIVIPAGACWITLHTSSASGYYISLPDTQGNFTWSSVFYIHAAAVKQLNGDIPSSRPLTLISENQSASGRIAVTYWLPDKRE